ncbi:hypothetical protein [Perlabentimonas gracilis]|uniref:hypothetical protein n=1 Tax=Perlabentimonas gracilis TaxID=2715279 RepID=UPI00140CA7EB|nr:hypothetical protein [Perlabentimonas gracilis]NHB70227.1 hypothetical protein [Perlabentimonas gracilis]
MKKDDRQLFMRLLTILLILITQVALGQKTITYEYLYEGFKDFNGVISISLYSQLNEKKEELYLISLQPKGTLSEPPIYDTSRKKYLRTDIVIDEIQSKEIVEILDISNYLSNFYFFENEYYINVKNPIEREKFENAPLVIELYVFENASYLRTFIPIIEKKKQKRYLMIFLDFLINKRKSYLKK